MGLKGQKSGLTNLTTKFLQLAAKTNEIFCKYSKLLEKGNQPLVDQEISN